MTKISALIAVALTACGVSDSTDLASDDLSGPTVTLATANESFTTQWGPTAFNSAGAPYGYDDCGPTSLLMTAAYLGYLARPNPSDAEAGINYARYLTRGDVSTESGATYLPMMVTGFTALDASASELDTTIAAVDAALENGAVVPIAGDPKNAWGLELDGKGEYLHHYTSAADDTFGHWVVIFGRATDGERYVVGDPLSTIGTIKVTATEVRRYWADYLTLDDGAAAAIVVK
jgi:hypothetical protein